MCGVFERYIESELWEQVDNDVGLEFVRSWYVLTAWVSQLEDRDRKELGFIKEGEQVKKCVHPVFGTEELENGMVLKSSFDLKSVGMRTQNGCRLEKSIFY